MSDSKFKDFLKNKITKEQINLKEAKRLGHFAELGDLNVKTLRSERSIPTFNSNNELKTPIDQPIPPVNPIPNIVKDLSRLHPEEISISRKLSFEDISGSFHINPYQK